jgi:RNA polymerase sigma-B factor
VACPHMSPDLPRSGSFAPRTLQGAEVSSVPSRPADSPSAASRADDTSSSDSGAADASSEPPRADGETLALLRRAQCAGAAERRDLQAQVVERHLGLADALASRYGRNRPDADDLRQVARVGLVEAVQRFDPARGDFIAFAVPTIIGLLKRYFRDHSWLVRPPRSTQELSIRVRDSWPVLAQQLGGEPSSSDIARELHNSTESVCEARLASVGFAGAALVVNDPRLSSPDAELEFDRCEARMIVASTLDKLSESERELLSLRFFSRLSQEEIALRTGTNQMHVSRQLSRLMVKLRELVGSLEDSPSPAA